MTTEMGAGMGIGANGRDEARKQADEQVAKRFTRQMRAAVSPYGVLTDPPLVFTVLAVIAVPSIILYASGVIAPAYLPLVYGVAALPLLVMAIANVAVMGARARVVDWLASLPFPVDNVNALLNGVGQHLLIRFEASPPEREALNAKLERVHEDCFTLEYADEEPEVEVHIGVLDSKYNPVGAAHRRYERVRQLVEQALVPMLDEHPIERVRVC